MAEHTTSDRVTKPAGRPNIVGVRAGLGPLEARLVRALAEAGRPLSVREVCDRVQKGGYFAYTGVFTSLNRLADKGILTRELVGRTYHYRLRIEPEALTAEVLTEVATEMGADLHRVAARLLGIDPDRGAPALAQLRERLGTPRRNRRR